MRAIVAAPLSAAVFAPFGHVIATPGAERRAINAGRCIRHHDLAPVEVLSGRAGLSLFVSEPVSLPHAFDLMERHPEGSQAFMPLSDAPFLVIVAPDAGGAPGAPLAFVTAPGQGVSYRAGVWHGVLTPLEASQRFLVVDRIGPGANLQEHRWAEAWTVTAPQA